MNDVLNTSFPLDYVSISASYSIGQTSPLFTIILPPREASAASYIDAFSLEEAWEDIKAVEDEIGEVTFSIFDLSWTCQWTDTDVSVSPAGITKTLHYTPTIIQEQLYSGFGQDIFFYSVPLWEYQKIEADLDFSLLEAHHKESDDYPTNGFTTKDIIKIIALYAEKSYDVNIPTCHVNEKTVVCRAGSPYIKFIEGLLIGDLDNIIFASDEQVVITTIVPQEHTNSYPDFYGDSSQISVSRKNKSAYDAFHFVGGDGRPVLSDYAYDGIVYQTPDLTEKTHWEETEETRGDMPVTVASRKTKQLDPFGELFLLLSQEEVVTGKVPRRSDPSITMTTVVEKTTTSYIYDNNQSLYYERARLLESESIKKSFCYRLIDSYYAPDYGVSYYLTANLEVINSTEYDALSSKPQIFVTAYYYNADTDVNPTGDDFSTTTHTIEYASESEARDSKDVLEGMILEDYERVEKYGASITVLVGITSGSSTVYRTRDLGWIPCDVNPRDALLSLAAQVQDADIVSGFNITNESLECRYTKTTYERIDAGMFEAVVEQGDYNFQTKSIESQIAKNRVPSESVPAVPTQVRKQRLQKKTGNLGSKQTVMSQSFSIPTANRTDFDYLAELLQHIAENEFEPVTYTAVAKEDFVLPGHEFQGRTAVGFTIAETPDSGYDIAITAK